MDIKVSFTGHIDVTVGRTLAMLEFLKRLYCKFRDPYTLKTLYVSLVRPKLEYASCVWWPFYGAYIDRIERVQRSSSGKHCVVWGGRTCLIFLHMLRG
jgi:hypothetical protein